MVIIETLDDVRQLFQTFDGHFAKYHTQCRDDEKFYDLDFAEMLSLPKQFEDDAVILPTARDVIESAVNHITPGFRRVTVPRKRADKPSTLQAKKLQRFYEALLFYLERISPDSSFREGIKHLILYGLTIWKFGYDRTKWTAEPKRHHDETDEAFATRREDWRMERGETMPFFLQIIHPEEIIFDPFNDPPEWVIQNARRYVYEVRNLYPHWKNSEQRRNTEQVDVREYWGSKQRSVLVDNQSALEKDIMRNPWGINPYIISASGLGYDNYKHEPEKKFVGLLRYLRDVLVSESRSFSMADIVIKVSGWPVRVAQGDRADEMPEIKLEYGTIQPIPAGVEIKDLSPQLPPELVFSHLSAAGQIIAKTAAPNVVRGIHQPGQRSGFQQQLLLGQARLRYSGFASSIERALSELCRKAATLMERVVPGSVSVAAGATQDEIMLVSGKDFSGHHAVQVKVNVMEPEDEVRKHQDAANMVAMGLWSPQTALRKISPDVDPASELGRVLAARLLFSPQVMGLLSQAFAEKVAGQMGLEEVLERITASLQEGGVQSGKRPTATTETPPAEGSPEEQGQQRTQALRTEQ